MKTFRAAYLTLLVVLFLTALYSGHRALYVLLCLQVLLLLAALAMNLWSAFTFAYVQDLNETASIRGETVHLRLEIHNERPFPYPMMRIRVRTVEPGRPWEATFNLSGHAHIAFDIPIPCPYRGEYTIGLDVVEIRDIFGLLVLPFRMNRLPYYREKTIRVHPRVTRLPERAHRPPDAKAYVRFTAQHADAEESYSHTRAYLPGDRARQIHWKLSSRLGQLQSRQYDIATEPSMLVLIDASPGPYSGEAALQWQDAACSCAATLIAHVLHQRYRVTLLTGDEQAAPVHGQSMADYAAFDWALTRLSFHTALTADDLLAQNRARSRDYGSIVLITHREPGSSLLHGLLAMRRPDADLAFVVAQPDRARTGSPLQADADATGFADGRQGEAAVTVMHAAYGDDLALLLGDFL